MPEYPNQTLLAFFEILDLIGRKIVSAAEPRSTSTASNIRIHWRASSEAGGCRQCQCKAILVLTS